MTVGFLCAIVLALDAAAASPDAGAPAAAVPKANVVAKQWQAQHAPSAGPPLSIGGYSLGCLQGAAVLPASGPGYEALRLGRNRRYGHPTLIAYVRRLAASAKAAKLGPLVVGDLSQPRGGPTPSGHRSHQTGLDADIGFAAPPGLRLGHLTARDRERLSPPAVVDLQTHKPTAAWKATTPRLIALAASDPAVDRIFVNPGVKQMLCAGETGKAGKLTKTTKTTKAPWQGRVRPWWGHHDHFHVRLKCPADSELCVPQDPPPDDGCGASLDWWFTSDAENTRSRRKDAEAVEAEPQLPPACGALLDPTPDAKSP